MVPVTDEERAERYFDECISFSLVQDGVSKDGIAHLRQQYVRFALDNPAAVEELRAKYPGRFDLGEGYDMGEQDPEEIDDAEAFALHDQEKAAGTVRTVLHEEVRVRLGMTKPGPIEGLRLALAQLPDDAVIVIEDTAGGKYVLREVNGVLDVSLKDGANSTTLHLVIEEVQADLAGPGWQGGTS